MVGPTYIGRNANGPKLKLRIACKPVIFERRIFEGCVDRGLRHTSGRCIFAAQSVWSVLRPAARVNSRQGFALDSAALSACS